MMKSLIRLKEMIGSQVRMSLWNMEEATTDNSFWRSRARISSRPRLVRTKPEMMKNTGTIGEPLNESDYAFEEKEW